MASVTFIGDSTISDTNSMLALSGITSVYSANYTNGAITGAPRIKNITGDNQATGEALRTVKLTTTGFADGHEVVTGLSATAGYGAETHSVVQISGLRISTDFDDGDIFGTGNIARFQDVLANCLAGDDNFDISGAVTQFWGDYQSIQSGQKLHLGDDFMTISYITQVPGSYATFYGDAQFVAAGARASGGDDVLDAAFSIVPVTLYGDFQKVDGKAVFGNDDLFGSTKDDILYGDSQVATNAGGRDNLHGGDGNDELYGGGGNDVLTGGFGGDLLDGGKGFDIANYAQSQYLLTELVVDLVDTSQNTNAALGDTFFSIEGLRGRNLIATGDDLRGNDAANKIWGLAGDDQLSGRGGKDMLSGDAGNDRLEGGLGSDKLIGGDGSDVFVFNTALNSKHNVDRIIDFNIELDKIELDHAIMTSLDGSSHVLSDDAFFASNSGRAHDASDRIIYEKDTGKLFYDEDGTGDAGRILFAILSGKPHIVAADFDIV